MNQPTTGSEREAPRAAEEVNRDTLFGIELCRGWLYLQLRRENCNTTAFDLLEDLEAFADNENRFRAEVLGSPADSTALSTAVGEALAAWFNPETHDVEPHLVATETAMRNLSALHNQTKL